MISYAYSRADPRSGRTGVNRKYTPRIGTAQGGGRGHHIFILKLRFFGIIGLSAREECVGLQKP